MFITDKLQYSVDGVNYLHVARVEVNIQQQCLVVYCLDGSSFPLPLVDFEIQLDKRT